MLSKWLLMTIQVKPLAIHGCSSLVLVLDLALVVLHNRKSSMYLCVNKPSTALATYNNEVGCSSGIMPNIIGTKTGMIAGDIIIHNPIPTSFV